MFLCFYAREIQFDLPQGITHNDLFDDDIQDYNDGMSDMASLTKDDVYADFTGDQPSSRGVSTEQQGKPLQSG